MGDPLKVFTTTRKPSYSKGNLKCAECGQELGYGDAWIFFDKKKGPLCLTCADLDHLVFLPSGDAALTRRSRKHSRLYAVVLKWSSARKRYERQGILVENEAIERAEEECEADAEQREIRRAWAQERRAELDQKYVESFAAKVRELYPGCPEGREWEISKHACLKYSGRVGRSASAKELDEDAVALAVVAHIRHTETDYDEMLLQGIERHEARRDVRSQVDGVLLAWGKG